VPQHAHYADLCILGQAVTGGTDSGGYTFGEQLLFVTALPVLFIPAFGSFTTLGRHILVAWNVNGRVTPTPTGAASRCI
jgi:hypothetical protein